MDYLSNCHIKLWSKYTFPYPGNLLETMFSDIERQFMHGCYFTNGEGYTKVQSYPFKNIKIDFNNCSFKRIKNMSSQSETIMYELSYIANTDCTGMTYGEAVKEFQSWIEKEFYKLDLS